MKNLDRTEFLTESVNKCVVRGSMLDVHGIVIRRLYEQVLEIIYDLAFAGQKDKEQRTR